MKGTVESVEAWEIGKGQILHGSGSDVKKFFNSEEAFDIIFHGNDELR